MRNLYALAGAAVLVLSGCTVEIQDSRLTRQEVAAALSQRDQAIEAIIAKIRSLEPQPKEKPKK